MAATFKRVSPAAREEMRARARRGERLSMIAAAFGYDRTTVYNHTRDVEVAANATCPCGKPAPHTGSCNNVTADDLARLRVGLLAGKSIGQLAREMAMSASVLGPPSRLIVAELRAAGVRCACGAERGHYGLCTPYRYVRSLDDLSERVRAGILAGESRTEMAKTLGERWHLIRALAQPMIDEMAAAGVKCGCGKLIDHPYVCADRRRRAASNGIRYSGSALTVPQCKRSEIAAMIRAGTSIPAVCRRADVPREVAEAIASTIAAAPDPDKARYSRMAMARVRAAVPMSIGQIFRESVVAEIHKAVIEERLDLGQIEIIARSFAV